MEGFGAQRGTYTYHVPASEVFDLLIELSCKEAHPLNAEFLHQVLMKKELVKRDIVNLYHYAMQFIFDELGYSDEQLGWYDSKGRDFSYSRHTVKKVERIGKKYQWIKSIPSKLLLRDTGGYEWVTLNLYDSLESKRADDSGFGYKRGSQEIWMWAHGCLISEEDFFKIIKKRDKICVPIQDLRTDRSVYQLFNREYVWSPGCASVLESPWEECNVEVGPKHTVIKKIEGPELCEDDNLDILLMYGGEREIERQEPSEVLPVEIMLSYIQVLWEEEYDASQEDTTSFYIPCVDIMEKLKLAQREHDGYYYAPSGDLVCFDGKISGRYNGLLIRKDYLEQYLTETGLRLFWTCYGEKQFFRGGNSQEWSTWSGLLSFENGAISGTIKLSEQ